MVSLFSHFRLSFSTLTFLTFLSRNQKNNTKKQKLSAAAEAARGTQFLEDIPFANTYYPTREQWADPLGYVESIQSEAARQGEECPPFFCPHANAVVVCALFFLSLFFSLSY